MNANQWRTRLRQVAHGQSNRFLHPLSIAPLEAKDAEMPVATREICVGDLT